MSSAASVVRTFQTLLPARRRLVQRDDAVVASQIALAEIPAPTGQESRRAQTVLARLRTLGVEAQIDEAGNVVGWRDGVESTAPVVVCAHLDTVFHAEMPHAVQRTGDRISGPGIGDNARGLAAMLAIADALVSTGVRTTRPLLFAATTGEEGMGDLRGARHLFAGRAARASAAIALDGAGDERVVTHALGIRRYRVAYAGPGGHSWAAWGVANPLHAAATLAAELARLELTATPRTTLTVSRMSGGTAINAIPSDAWLEIDARSTASAALVRVDRQVRQAAQGALERENARRRSDSAALTLQIDVIGDRPAGSVGSDAFLAHAAFDATRLVGRHPESATASTDANVPLSLGIPAIALGAGGRGGDTHTAREWYENRDGTLGIARAMTILVAVAGVA